MQTKKNHSAKSCDFAELIWSGQVSEYQQIRLLESSHNLVRQAVAWAIADLGRDNKPMRHLFEIGASDSNPQVRANALWGVKEAQFLSDDEKLQLLREFSDDTDERVISIAKQFPS